LAQVLSQAGETEAYGCHAAGTGAWAGAGGFPIANRRGKRATMVDIAFLMEIDCGSGTINPQMKA
jgi:hypothetical protein